MSSPKDEAAIVEYLVASEEPQKLTEISKRPHVSGVAPIGFFLRRGIGMGDPGSGAEKVQDGVGLLELAPALVVQLDLKTLLSR